MAITFGSKNEENVYIALKNSKEPFEYQVPFFGGRSVRGGIVVDFIVHIAPKPVAIWVQGEYWHRRKSTEDSFAMDRMRKAGYYPVELTEAETMTIDAASAAVKAKVL